MSRANAYLPTIDGALAVMPEHISAPVARVLLRLTAIETRSELLDVDQKLHVLEQAANPAGPLLRKQLHQVREQLQRLSDQHGRVLDQLTEHRERGVFACRIDESAR